MAHPEESIRQSSFSTARLTCLYSILAIIVALSPAAHAQTLTVLHTFNGAPDGREPIAGVTRDAAGNVYGTTYYGGTYDLGLVYKLAHKGSGWVLSPLYSFQRGQGAGGYAPVGGLTIGSDGNLYGTASLGGPYDAGTVYKLSPPASVCKAFLCPWTETPLYYFTGGADGGTPEAALIFDSAGNMYGTSASGGTGDNGVVFKLTRSGSGWTESVLYSFANSPDGAGPFSSVTFDGNGNLYGTTNGGGTGFGTVYQLTPSGSGWTERVIYAFQGLNDGSLPYAGIVLDPDGNLYGATFYTGARNGGTIFELTPSNGNWIFSVIYSPLLEGVGGPAGTLARSSNGTLYGTLLTGGDTQRCFGYGCGSVFQLAPSNGGWVFTSLYEFTDGADGGNPEGGLILDSAGNLYGTTTGSLGGDGSVFELTP
jgi:uncharacterized repeat protein (TIGR03803 family)